MTRLWWRALASRPFATVVLLLLAGVAVATAALGPLLVRAMQQSALADTLADAGSASALVTASVRLDAGASYAKPRAQVLVPFSHVDQGPDGALWTAPTLLVGSSENISWTAPGSTARTVTRVNAAEAGCAGYVLTGGRCPSYVGETLVSADDAARTGLRVDDLVAFRLAASPVRALRVVGSYDADRSLPGLLVRPGSVASGIGQGPVNPDGDYDGEQAGVAGAPTGDPLVVGADQLFALRLPVEVSANLALRHGVDLAHEAAARATLASVDDLAAHGVPGRVLFADSDLGSVLDRADRLSADAAVVIGVSVVQAFALAFFALAIVLQRIGRARAAEWGVGRLRGVGRRRWFGSILIEPAVPLVLGLPAGIALAGLVGRLAVDARLRPGTPLELTRWPVLAAAGAAFLAAAVALTLLTVAAVRRPTVELIQQSAERRRLSRVALVAQAAVVLLAGAAVYQLRAEDTLTSGRSQLGLLAPALVAIAVAVLAVRAGVLAVRRVTARPPRSRVGLVAGRQIGRTPSSLNPAIVIAAGVALTVFAGQVLALSVRNQDLRARADVGAGTVLQVSPPRGSTLIDAVATADPSGRYAMAAKEVAGGSSSGTSRIIAVDATRFDAVTTWSPGWSDVPDLGARLRADASPSIELRGRTVTLDLQNLSVLTRPGTDGYTGIPITGVKIVQPRLILVVAGPGGWADVTFPALPGGNRPRRTLTADLPGCANGCRLVGLVVAAEYGTSFDVTFTLTGLSTDRQPVSATAAALRSPGWYQPLGDPDNLQTVSSTAGVGSAAGLAVQSSSPDGVNGALLRPGDTTEPWPVLLGPLVPLVPVTGMIGVVLGNGLDTQAITLRPVGKAAVLPRSLADGVLVDLRTADFAADPRTNQAASEVWLAADAPPSVEQALVAAGVEIRGRETLAAARAALDRQPPTRAASVATFIGYAALALALLTLLASRLADAGRRRLGWRALREAGLSSRSVWGLAAVEILVPAVLGTLVGVAAGAVVVRLAAPRLPLVDAAVTGPPLDLHLAWAPIVAVATTTVVLILLVAAVVAAVETRPREDR